MLKKVIFGTEFLKSQAQDTHFNMKQVRASGADHPLRLPLDSLGPEGFHVDAPMTRLWLTDVLGQGFLYQATQDGHVTAHVTRVEDTVYVQGRMSLTVSAPCCRCLTPVVLKLDTPIGMVLVPASKQAVDEKDAETFGEEVGMSTYENHGIDLGHVVREEIVLSLPMRALCSESCAGLCSLCGHDLNQGPCACTAVHEGPLSALKNIKLHS